METNNLDKKFRKSILVTLIISTLIIFVTFILLEKYYLENEFKKQVLNSSSLNITKKEKELNKLINDTKNSLKHISNLEDFKNAIKTNRFNHIKNIFLTLSQSNVYFMQLRYLDAQGKERLRVDRNKNSPAAFIVENHKLQDKSSRDYFLEAKDKKDIFISNLDLNMENNQIEFPYKSTIRVVLPIFENEEFMGELVMNLELNLFFDTTLFDIMISNSKGKVILPFDKEQKNFEKNIRNYLPSNIEEEITKYKKFIYKNYISYKLDTSIKNEVILILKLKDEYFKEFQKDQIKLRTLIFGILLIFVIIVIFIVFKKLNQLFYFYHKSKLEQRLKFSDKEFKSANTLLSKNIDPELILSQSTTSMILTDENIKILYVNSAFSKLYGYLEEEVIGKDPGFLRNEDIEQKGITKLRMALKDEKSTTVVIRNYTKSGELKYIELSISPIFKENSDRISYYLGIHKDVTKEQKILKDLKRMF